MHVCNVARWLDRGEDDGSIERELVPAEEKETEQLPEAIDKLPSDDLGQTLDFVNFNQTDNGGNR